MSLGIRRLSPDTDGRLFDEVQRWLDESPSWRRTDDPGDPTDPCRIDIGVFVDNCFAADVALVLRSPGVYEVYLDAKRGTSLDVLVEAGRTIRDQMFDYGMQTAFVWVPRQHRTVKAVIKAIGFRPDYVSMLHGNGQLVERERYSLRSTDGRQ